MAGESVRVSFFHMVVDLSTFLAIGLIAGFVLGMIGACLVTQDVHDDWSSRVAIKAACINGNDHACRVYEVDYAR